MLNKNNKLFISMDILNKKLKFKKIKSKRVQIFQYKNNLKFKKYNQKLFNKVKFKNKIKNKSVKKL